MIRKEDFEVTYVDESTNIQSVEIARVTEHNDHVDVILFNAPEGVTDYTINFANDEMKRILDENYYFDNKTIKFKFKA
jgi:hypothetical protein